MKTIFTNTHKGTLALALVAFVSALIAIFVVLPSLGNVTGDHDALSMEASIASASIQFINPPACPFKGGANKTVFDLNERIYSSRGEKNSETGVDSTNLPAGNYKVSLFAWDGYVGRTKTRTQNNEQYYLSFLNGGSEIARSGATSDLKDGTETASKKQVVNGSLTINKTITGVQAVHAAYPDTASANSILPVCAVVERIPDPLPSCDAFGANPDSITKGDTTTLTWKTTDATEVMINNGVGSVDVDGSKTVSPTSDTTYTLTAKNVEGSKTCTTKVVVKQPENPKRPACPFNGGADRTVVSFNHRLRSDQASGAETSVKGVNLASGSYKVTLFSWDGYTGRTQTKAQPNEKWKLELLNGSSVVATSGVIGDIQDGVEEASRQQVVNGKLVVASAVNGIKAVHAVYPDNSSANSVEPVCAMLEKIEESAPTCDAFGISPTTINKGDSATMTWETTKATQVSIDQGIGAVAVDGSRTVSPTVDTTYTLTATGAGGTATCNTKVIVKQPENPKRPVCPFASGADRTIVSFDKRLRSDQASGAETVVKAVNLASGSYKVTLFSWDGYTGRTQTKAQPNERWKLSLLNGSSVVKTSGVIADLKDGVEEASRQQVVNDKLVVGNAVNGIKAVHAFYPDASSANSVEPICAMLEKIEEPAPTCDAFTGTPETLPVGGGDVTLAWETTNATDVSINQGVGAVAADGSKVVQTAQSKTYTLTATGAGGTVTCKKAIIVKTPDPKPQCTLTADPNAITNGGSSTLTWTSVNADTVTIDQSIGVVTANGNTSVSPTVTTIYTMTATGYGKTVTCTDTITVTEVPNDPAITIVKRDASDKDDTQEVAKGGTAQFEIVVTNTGDVALKDVVVTDPITNSCAKTIGSLAIDASDTYTCTSTDVQSGFTNIAYVTGKSVEDDTQVSDDDPTDVTVPAESTLSCDSFTASPDSFSSSGGDTTLTWKTTGATSVSIDQGIGSVDVDGSKTGVSVSSDTTYTLTATDGTDEITCKASVDVASGGGGGGSSSPRCDLEISDKKIKVGEEITLTWDNTRTNDITLIDNRGNVIIDTDRTEDLNVDEDEGSITLKPTKDTEYTLTAIKGSKDRECKVAVEIEEDDEVTLSVIRDQQPLVVSLGSVPYTGFEAGPTLTAIFYTLLILWSLGVAYVLVIRKEAVLGFQLPDDVQTTETTFMPKSVTAPEVTNHTIPAATDIPSNLPVADYVPVVGYSTQDAQEEAVEIEFTDGNDDIADDITALENRANEASCLLSSNAIRFIIDQSETTEEQFAMLETIIGKAKELYPLEDGWMVINKERAIALMNTAGMKMAAGETAQPEVAHTTSLADAILKGDVVAAYATLGDKPLEALATAATELDAQYRAQKGQNAAIDAKYEAAIGALASAIDGTYTDETAAVKLAVMKAVTELA